MRIEHSNKRAMRSKWQQRRYGPFLLLIIALTALPGRAFSDSTAGVTTPGTNVYPTKEVPRIVDELRLNPIGYQIICGVVDTSGEYAYCGLSQSPYQVIKVHLPDMTVIGSLTLNTAWDYATPAVFIDHSGNYAYFASGTGHVYKVHLADMTVSGALALSSSVGIECAAIDPTDSYAYLGSSNGKIFKVHLSDMTETTSATLPDIGSNIFTGAVIESAGTYGYFFSTSGLGFKVRISDMTVAGTMTVSRNAPRSAVIDRAGTYAYIGIDAGYVIKVRLADMKEIASLNIGTGGDRAVIDPMGTYAYFGAGYGGIVKVRLADLTNAGSMGTNFLLSMMSDPTGTYAYFGTNEIQGRLFKVALNFDGAIRTTRMTLSEGANVQDVRFYSHHAGGRVRLAIYEDGASTLTLCWQSTATSITQNGGWLRVPVSAGSPSALPLKAGTYWLAFNTEGTSGSASYLPGNGGSGFWVQQPFENFPAVLEGVYTSNDHQQPTGNNWAEYLTYTAYPIPAAPSNPYAIGIGTDHLTWTWRDNSNNETGFMLWADGGYSAHTLRTTTAPNVTSWTMRGLTPNAPYIFQVAAASPGGDSARSVNFSFWTLAAPPTVGKNVACNQAINLRQLKGTVFTFRNPAGFGTSTDGGSPWMVSRFRYAFDTKTTHTFTGSEPVWNSGTLSQAPAVGGSYYLHLQSINTIPDMVTSTTLNWGPFILDPSTPGVPMAGIGAVGTNVYPENELFRTAGSLTLPASDNAMNDFASALMDPAGVYAYFAMMGTKSIPGQVIKIRLADMKQVGGLTLGDDERDLISAAIDPSGTYAYFGEDNRLGVYPSKVIKVRLADMAKVGTLTLKSDLYLSPAVIDRAGDYVYFGALHSTQNLNDFVGEVVKVRLSDMTQATTRTLIGSMGGCYPFVSAGLDPTGNYAYFASQIGKVVKMKLTDMTNAGELTLASKYLEVMTIAPAGDYAYVGRFGYLSKVRLSDMTEVGAPGPNLSCQPLCMAVIDSAGTYAYLGDFYSQMLKVRLSDMTRVGSLALGGFCSTNSGVLDPAGAYAYIGVANMSNSTVYKLALNFEGAIRASRMTLTEGANVQDVRFYSHHAGGRVRLAIYEDGASTRTLRWQSAATSNTVSGDWLRVPVSAGNPTSLILQAGTYWLAFNTEGTSGAASFLPGSGGTGFWAQQPFGNFPALLGNNAVQLTSDNWAEYLTYTPTLLPRNSISQWELYNK